MTCDDLGMGMMKVLWNVFFSALLLVSTMLHPFAKDKMFQGINIVKPPLAKESSANLHIAQSVDFGCDSFH